MLKLALAALVVAGYSTMADAKVVTYTYAYAFDHVEQTFEGFATNQSDGSYYFSVAYSGPIKPRPAKIEVAVDTAVHSLPGLTLEWFGRSAEGVTTTMPGYDYRFIRFGRDGMPRFWTLSSDVGSITTLNQRGDSSYSEGYAWLDALGKEPFNFIQAPGLEGGGAVSTSYKGPAGTWTVSEGAPYPTPLPASVLLLLGGIGALAFMRRGASRHA